MKRSFASDNYAGAHPQVMQALIEANTGHATAYGYDEVTARATARFEALLGPEISVQFVLTGTGANVLGLKSMLRPHQAVICSQTAHIHLDETGAAEAVIGCKLLPVAAPDGKVTVAAIQPYLRYFGDEHCVQPGVISLTQPTELGTLYTVDEIRSLAEFARQRGLRLHMDGARLANAAAALNLALPAFTRDLGIDVLSFGGAKNGLLFGEAIVFFDLSLAQDFKYLRKQGLQLASKMRFIAAQFEALLTDDLWLHSAAHANRMAQLLAEQLRPLPQVQILHPVQTNVVFARLPRALIPGLQAQYPFYVWEDDPEAPIVRLMTAFDTTEADIAHFIQEIR